MRDQVVALLREGQTLETAARLAGIHRDTLHEWRRRGVAAAERQAQGEKLAVADLAYVEFEAAVSQARAEAEATAVAVIWSAMPRDWRAAAWYLERSVPKHWSRRSHAEIEIAPHGQTLTSNLTRGRELREAAEARLALASAPPETSAEECSEVRV
jgi:hypothetical protein